jgi:hypothetical protein
MLINHRLLKLLESAPGQQLPRRDIFKRLSYDSQFAGLYEHLLGKTALREYGTGKKGDPIVVRLEKSDYLK